MTTQNSQVDKLLIDKSYQITSLDKMAYTYLQNLVLVKDQLQLAYSQEQFHLKLTASHQNVAQSLAAWL